MHPVRSERTTLYMVANLVRALRRRRKPKDAGNYIAKATEFAGWMEPKDG
jgi:hypothetical protein